MITKQLSLTFFSLLVLLLLASASIALTPGLNMREYTFVEMALPHMYVDSCQTYDEGGLVETFEFEAGQKFIKVSAMVHSGMNITCFHVNATSEMSVLVELLD